MKYPLVADLADEGIPVAVTCRLLGFSKQAYFKWRAKPVCHRDLSDAICSMPPSTPTTMTLTGSP
jgi:putative transposase